jgi:hypothetical protein
MPEIHYGVVRQEGLWRIIGDHLRFGSYRQQSSAVAAARRLAENSAAGPVQLHVQQETGELLPPETFDEDR